MTTAAFVPTRAHSDGSAVTIYETKGLFLLVVRRGGCVRSRQIAAHEAHAYRALRRPNIEREIFEMKEELTHAIRQCESTALARATQLQRQRGP